jgi:hypothetical protein
MMETAGSEGERGSVLVLVAVFLPVALIFVSFVLSLGDWWIHKRHLQIQADAAALSAAQELRYPCTSAIQTAIANTAAAYAGGTYNPQVSAAQSRVHVQLNQTDYYKQTGKPGDTDMTGDPCVDKAVDVKVTETDAPALFKSTFNLLNIAKFINARARVSIVAENQRNGVLPVAVPDPNPVRARVMFIDEAASGHPELAHADLTKGTSSGGITPWSTSSSMPINITSSKIGVRVALSGDKNQIACSDQLVTCFDLDPNNANTDPVDDSNANNNGLVLIRGWSADPAVSPSSTATDKPQARAVSLIPDPAGTNPCQFSGSFIVSTTACTVKVSATVDFNGSSGQTSTSKGSTNIDATIQGTKVNNLQYSNGHVYSKPATIDPTKPGPFDVTLDWSQTGGSVDMGTSGSPSVQICKTGNGNKCADTFGAVQRGFVATPARSGPVKSVRITEGGGTTSISTLQRCSASLPTCPHSFDITVGVDASVSGPQLGTPTTLRVGANGSQNQSVDCDPNISTLKDELANGCSQPYRLFTAGDTPCPNNANQLTTLYGNVWPCVAIQTGKASNQVPAGMNQRVLGDQQAKSCTGLQQNQYPTYPVGDKRIVPVFLVPYGSFQGNGSGTIPVTGFAEFYVTGWTSQGNGFDDPCPQPPDELPTPADSAYIVGRFIKPVDPPSGGSGDPGQPCDPTNINACIAMLTK